MADDEYLPLLLRDTAVSAREIDELEVEERVSHLYDGIVGAGRADVRLWELSMRSTREREDSAKRRTSWRRASLLLVACARQPARRRSYSTAPRDYPMRCSRAPSPRASPNST